MSGQFVCNFREISGIALQPWSYSCKTETKREGLVPIQQILNMIGVSLSYLQELTLARTSYFAILDRTWGGGQPPGSFAPN